jgi:hypothetical protein
LLHNTAQLNIRTIGVYPQYLSQVWAVFSGELLSQASSAGDQAQDAVARMKSAVLRLLSNNPDGTLGTPKLVAAWTKPVNAV